jgi:hypothetical protein
LHTHMHMKRWHAHFGSAQVLRFCAFMHEYTTRDTSFHTCTHEYATVTYMFVFMYACTHTYEYTSCKYFVSRMHTSTHDECTLVFMLAYTHTCIPVITTQRACLQRFLTASSLAALMIRAWMDPTPPLSRRACMHVQMSSCWDGLVINLTVTDSSSRSSMLGWVQPYPCLAARACTCRCCIFASHHLYKVPCCIIHCHHVHPGCTSSFPVSRGLSSPKSSTHMHSFSYMCAWMNAQCSHTVLHACTTHLHTWMHDAHILVSWYAWMHDTHTLVFHTCIHEHMTWIHCTVSTHMYMNAWIHHTHKRFGFMYV